MIFVHDDNKYRLVSKGARQCVDVLLSMLCPARRSFGLFVHCWKFSCVSLFIILFLLDVIERFSLLCSRNLYLAVC